MSETDLVRETIEKLSKYERRLFRNNVGQAWAGRWERHGGGQLLKPLPAGTIIVYAPRAVKFGLAEGSGDVIGMRSIEVTPEMVGTRIAQFVSLEGKVKSGTSDEQRNWDAMVKMMGGISGQFRSVEDAAALLGVEKK